MSNVWSDAAFELAFAGVERGVASTSASVLIKVARTGAKPILAAADDGRRFWLKWPGNPHGNISLVNELIVARVGEQIGAPVRPVSLVYVDPALVEGFSAFGDFVPAGTHIGSELLADVEEATEILRVARDGNAERFPRFLALWMLCLGTDLQLLYHVSNEDQVWSIDHGLWFDTHEGDWTPSLLEEWVDDNWPWPEDQRPKGLSATALHQAADSVSELTVELLAHVVGEVPLQWGVDDANLKAIAKFVHQRRTLIASQLRTIAAHYS
jgi:hypothetical protein